MSSPNTKAISHQPLPVASPILTPQSIRQQLLEAAGMSSSEQARLVSRVFKKLEEKLDAKTTKFFSFEGEIIDQADVEDNMAQLRAAEGLAHLTGIEPSKDINASAVKIVVEVKLPDWAKPIDVTHASLDGQGQVIEEAVISRPSE